MVGMTQECELQSALPGNAFHRCTGEDSIVPAPVLARYETQCSPAASPCNAASGIFLGSSPYASIAFRTEVPCASRMPRSSSSNLPTSARLPMNGVPKRTPSSSEKPTTSIANGSRSPCSSSSSATASTTPEDAVVGTGVRNRIEVRTDQEPWQRSAAQQDKLHGNYRQHRCARRAPSGSIHRAISWWQSRMGGERNVRRVLPVSSEKDASFRHRWMTSAARVVIAVVCTGFQFGTETLEIQDSRMTFAATQPRRTSATRTSQL